MKHNSATGSTVVGRLVTRDSNRHSFPSMTLDNTSGARTVQFRAYGICGLQICFQMWEPLSLWHDFCWVTVWLLREAQLFSDHRKGLCVLWSHLESEVANLISLHYGAWVNTGPIGTMGGQNCSHTTCGKNWSKITKLLQYLLEDWEWQTFPSNVDMCVSGQDSGQMESQSTTK